VAFEERLANRRPAKRARLLGAGKSGVDVDRLRRAPRSGWRRRGHGGKTGRLGPRWLFFRLRKDRRRGDREIIRPAEILDGGRFGALVPVGDDAAMATAIASTLDAPLRRPTLTARDTGTFWMS